MNGDYVVENVGMCAWGRFIWRRYWLCSEEGLSDEDDKDDNQRIDWGLPNANHTQTLDLADIYERFVYEDNLIHRSFFDYLHYDLPEDFVSIIFGIILELQHDDLPLAINSGVVSPLATRKLKHLELVEAPGGVANSGAFPFLSFDVPVMLMAVESPSRVYTKTGLLYMVAAAQDMNNTTTRSILQQEKLTGPNFTNWYRNLRIVLRYEGKLTHLEHPLIPLPLPITPQAVRDSYESLYDAQNEMACLMLGSMSLDLQMALENYKAYDMIQKLKTMFEEQAKHELFKTFKALYACKQEDGQSVSFYLLKMKSYLDTLECVGYVIPNELGVSIILNSLNKDYDQFVHNYNLYSMGKMIAELHAMLKLHEIDIPKKAENPTVQAIREGKIQKDKKKPQGAKDKDKGKIKLAYAPKSKISPPPKRDNLTKDSVCRHCKEVGHWRMNYPSYHAELKKRKNDSGTSTSGIFTIELYVFPNKSWVYDTGCGTHVCNTSRGLRGSKKLKDGALSLYVENGMRAAVETIGRFDLVLPLVQ
ncbi:hypothetical protein Tco_0750530 [Tanacetum coccineum]|uniref:Zinc finger, CCHC-type n=1 Tax=Tanacetum coccineum TaxID=301880 RepID=A0ABQ4Z1I9_9ASTR